MVHLKNTNRRVGIRIQTEFQVTAYVDGRPVPCMGVDLSTTGALVRRRSRRQLHLVQRVDLDLGELQIHGAARTVWSDGDLHAVRFIGLSDVDRLEIAEHLDRAS